MPVKEAIHKYTYGEWPLPRIAELVPLCGELNYTKCIAKTCKMDTTKDQ
jgi:hypothetical protein